MQYAILCYDNEAIVEAWSQEQDDEVITKHRKTEHELARRGKLGPVLRLLPTTAAMTVRSGDKPVIFDGPFAETKEQLLGLWIIDADTHEEAIEVARQLAEHKDSGSLEVRPLRYFAAKAAAA